MFGAFLYSDVLYAEELLPYVPVTSGIGSYGDLLYGSSLYAGNTDDSGVFLLAENVLVADLTPAIMVIFVVNDFIFNDDTQTTAPDASIQDSIKLNDWLTVKPSRTESAFHD
jgi:hypothetical protein